MKVAKLIEALQKYPNDMEICILDYFKNVHHADDGFTSHGIEPNFEVELIEEDSNMPFLALTFENSDYEDDGSPNECSSIYSSIKLKLAEDDTDTLIDRISMMSDWQTENGIEWVMLEDVISVIKEYFGITQN